MNVHGVQLPASWVTNLGPGDTVMALSLWEPWASLMAADSPHATCERGEL